MKRPGRVMGRSERPAKYRDEQNGADSTDGATRREERVLVLAPGAANRAVLTQVLSEAGCAWSASTEVDELAHQVRRGVGVLLLTEGALAVTEPTRLGDLLAAQPHWSDVPVIVLLEARRQGRMAAPDFQRVLKTSSVSLLEQPVRAFSLVSAVQAALRARRRQYEVRDAQAELERRVEERTRQVRELARALTLAEQRERRRLSQVLHDDLQQQLFGTRMQAFMAQRLIQQLEDAGDAAQAAGARAHLELVIEQVHRAIEATRLLTSQLHPPVHQDEGLADAFTWLAAWMGDEHALDVELEMDDACPGLEDDVALLLFNIVRELLFNVVEHAGVPCARLAVSRSADTCRVEVDDHGRGFDPEAIEQHTDAHTGFGLFSARGRLELVGGRMEIESSRGEGTHIVLSVPCS